MDAIPRSETNTHISRLAVHILTCLPTVRIGSWKFFIEQLMLSHASTARKYIQERLFTDVRAVSLVIPYDPIRSHSYMLLPVSTPQWSQVVRCFSPGFPNEIPYMIT